MDGKGFWRAGIRTKVSGYGRGQVAVALAEDEILAVFARIWANPLEMSLTPAATSSNSRKLHCKVNFQSPLTLIARILFMEPFSK